jgi:hypothetical protein
MTGSAGSLDSTNPPTINTSTIPIDSTTGIVDSIGQGGTELGALGDILSSDTYLFAFAGVVVVVLVMVVLYAGSL